MKGQKMFEKLDEILEKMNDEWKVDLIFNGNIKRYEKLSAEEIYHSLKGEDLKEG